MKKKPTLPVRDEDYKLLNERVTLNEKRFEEAVKYFQDDPLTGQPGILTRLSNNEKMDAKRDEENFKILHDIKKSIRELRYEIQTSNDKVDSMAKKLQAIDTSLVVLGMLSNKTTLTWVKYILWAATIVGFSINNGWTKAIKMIEKIFHI